IVGDLALVVEGLYIPTTGGQQNRYEGADHQCHRDAREDRENDQLFVFFEDGKAIEGDGPTVGEAREEVHWMVNLSRNIGKKGQPCKWGDVAIAPLDCHFTTLFG